MRSHAVACAATFILTCICGATMGSARAQQPVEPVDRTLQDGQAYALMNQATGFQLTAAGGLQVGEATRDLTSLSQRWGLARLADGTWKLADSATGQCLTETLVPGAVHAEPCGLSPFQHWQLTEITDGYWTLQGAWPGFLLNSSAGNSVTVSRAGDGAPEQAQLWQLRPAFWRGADVAEQEKMEALRVRTGLPWWKDADQPEDILKILKDHGFNAIRLRPTSIPPYYPDQDPSPCTGNYCYIESDTQELDLAKRARNLGMSLELTLFFDGGSSESIPGSWAGETQAQLAASVYSYTKAELEMYRRAGLMPDMVSIGNEVDTGFLGGPGVYPYNNFAQFAALEKAGLTAVADAASDPTLGAPLPAPLTCIHITPGYNMTSFFESANASGLQYDAICQSYYPIYHGPLTDAQAAETNPSNQPVEADTLLQAAQTIGKPIYIIETGEHYENGFESNDPWYAPTRAAQRQFLLDLEGVLHSLPNNLAMGMEYWAPNDVEMPDGGGPYSTFQKDYTTPNALFEWEGLGLFDSADPDYLTDPDAPNYSTALPGLDAVGGKEDATLRYKLVNRASGLLLGATGMHVGPGLPGLVSALDGVVDTHFEWSIASDNNGAFTVTNVGAMDSGEAAALDGSSESLVVAASANGSSTQAWDIQTAGGGFFYLVNKGSGEVLADDGAQGATQTSLSGAGSAAEWAIAPVVISTGK